jgi:ubiquinone/menaquinone biosynthesis C-methylase UbiE
MKDWDTLYKEGIIQKEPSKFALKAIDFFKKEKLKRILDLGCGTGRHTICLLKNGFKVYGCDRSENALKIAGEKIPGVEFKKCDMSSLPYMDNFFDGVLCHLVIQHGRIDDIKKAISEVYRVLRNRGILYLLVPSIRHPEYLTGEEIEPNTKINIDAIDGKVPHHYFTKDEIKELFRDFRILKLEHVEYLSEKAPNKKAAGWVLYAVK